MQPARPKPTLTDAGLQRGDEITFCFDHTITASVKSEHKIVFEGKTTTINAAALALLRRDGLAPRSVDGWSYWSFKGDLLSMALKQWWDDNPDALRPDELIEIQTVEHYTEVLNSLRPMEKQRFEHIDQLWFSLLFVNSGGSERFHQAHTRLFDQAHHTRTLVTSIPKR